MLEALLNSLMLSLGVAAVATLLGAPLGYLLARRGGLLSRLFLFLLLVPLAVPPYVLAMAWIDLLGRNGVLGQLLGQVFDGPASLGLYSLPGAIWVMALGTYPVPLLASYAGARGIDPEIEEAARLAGGSREALRSVILPLLLPAVSAGAVLAALLTLLAFAVPSLLQTPVFSFEVHSRFSTGGGIGESAGYAAVLGGLGLCVGGVWLAWVSRMLGRSGLQFRPANRRNEIAVVFFMAVVIVFCVLLPSFNLVRHAMPVDNLVQAWASAWEELATSLLLAACAATAGVAVGLLLAFGTQKRWGSLLWLSAVPYLISGPVLGIGLIYCFNAAGWRGALYDSFWIMVIACVLRHVIFAHGLLHVALRQLSREPEDASATLGASAVYRVLWVTLPRIAPWIAGAWFLLFVLSFGEVDTVLLVAPPGWTPLSVRLFSLMHYGPSGLVYALSLLAAAVVLGVMVVGYGLVRVLKTRFSV